MCVHRELRAVYNNIHSLVVIFSWLCGKRNLGRSSTKSPPPLPDIKAFVALPFTRRRIARSTIKWVDDDDDGVVSAKRVRSQPTAKHICAVCILVVFFFRP